MKWFLVLMLIGAHKPLIIEIETHEQCKAIYQQLKHSIRGTCLNCYNDAAACFQAKDVR